MPDSLSRRELLGAAAALPLLAMSTESTDAQTQSPSQPGVGPRRWAGRSVTIAPHGIVATSQPLAAQIGLDVLKRGGNAIDAAIATNAAMGLMEPMSCGIGGDLFAIVWHASSGKMHGLNASGRAPYRATRQLFADRGLHDIPTRGPLSWSVPGCVDGWAHLLERFGSMKLSELLAPSIAYAEEGFPVSEVIAGYWHGVETSATKPTPEFATTYMPGGRAPRVGEPFRNPQLARTYREIVAGGRDAYYKGRIAEAIVAYSEKTGGLFARKDFEGTAATWVDPVSASYRGVDVWELPPNGQGIAALQMLNILEGFDLHAMGAGSADYWHLFTEAKKLAYADRARYYADMEFANVPVAELISKEYAAARRKLIRTDRALVGVPAGDPKLGRSDTIYLCVVDKDHNCVSLIQSNYEGFGSGLVAGDLGFALQNRGTLFSLDPKHANTLEPHKRPFHTIIPAFATRNSKPWLTFGVMGGDMQPQGHVQILCNLLDFGMNLQEAGEAARIEHVGSASPKGRPEAAGGGTIQAEPGVPDGVLADLEKRGHHVQRVARNGGGYQAIMIHPKTQMLHGATEPRKDGMAVGY